MKHLYLKTFLASVLMTMLFPIVINAEEGYYYVGTQTGWDLSNKTYTFSKMDDGKTWTLTMNVESSDEFQIAPLSVESWNDSRFKVAEGSSGLSGKMSFSAFDGTNFSVNTEKPSSYTIKIVPSELTYEILKNDGYEQGNGTLDNPYNVAAALKKAGELSTGETSTTSYYIKGKISQIKSPFSVQYGTAIFWISDDGTTDSQFQIYAAYYLENKSWQDGDTQIALGDDVIIYGKLANYKGTLETANKESYIYSLNGKTIIQEEGYYYLGSQTSWDISDKTYKFTKMDDGKTWTLTMNVDSSDEFQIAPLSVESWGDWNLIFKVADGNSGLTGKMSVGEGDNFSVSTEKPSSYTIKIVPSEMTYQIMVNDGTEQGDISPKEIITVAEAIKIANELAVGDTSTVNYYIKGKISRIISYFRNYEGTADIDISDDGTNNNHLYVAGTFFLENSYWIDGYLQISENDDVIIYGKLENTNYGVYMVRKESYIYSLNGNTSIQYKDPATLQDRDNFVSKTPEGIDVIFIVKSNKEKTCTVGKTYYVLKENGDINFSYTTCAINNNTTGSITIPEIVNGYTVIGLESNAFLNCKKISTIDLPETIKTIGHYVFKGCSSLKSISVPQNVSSIGEEAFMDCSSLKTIEIPNVLKEINSFTFYGCKSLLEITIPSGIQKIKTKAFMNCTSLQKLNIPYYGDLQYIFSSAFENCESLAEIVFPWRCYSLGSRAFCGCKKITNINLSSFDTINSSTFEGCSNLQEITFEKYGNYTVKSIETKAFYGCNSLQSIIIPESLENISNDAFGNCEKLELVIIDNSNLIADNNSFTDLFGKQVKKYVLSSNTQTIGNYKFSNSANLQEIVIPESVTRIGQYAFSNCINLSTLTIPSNVSRIGRYAFADCSNLKFIDILSKIKMIDEGTFQGCESLEKIEFPNSLKTIESEAFSRCSALSSLDLLDNITTIKDHAFSECNSLLSVKIGTGLSNVGDSVFFGCTKIENVSISCVNIGDWFHGWKSIKELTIGKSVEKILEGAFSNCIGLKTVIINGANEIGNSAFSNCSSLTKITLPENLSSIGNRTFSGCNSLVSIEIPDSVSSIGESTFEGCSLLESVSIPSKVSIINYHTFKDCVGLQSIEIPNNIQTIGYSPFEGCINLNSVNVNSEFDYYKGHNTNLTSRPTYSDVFGTQVTNYILGDNIETITKEAFLSNKTIESLTIGSRVKEVERNALSTCANLKKIVIKDIKSWCGVKIVTDGKTNPFATNHHLYTDKDNEITDLVIPDGVETINDYVFYGCNSISSVYIPSSVMKINNNAFKGCEQLKKVIISDLAAWCSISFENSSDNPLSIAHHLYNADGTEITDLVIPEGVESINNYAFYGGSNFTSVTIPSSLKKIGNSAFYDCNNLSKVIISDLAAWCSTSFDNNPLWYAHRLYNINGTEIQDLTIPTGVGMIRDGAFSGCSSLKSLVIPNDVEYIGIGAFASCSDLATVVIPNSVKAIGSQAFADCMNLYSVTSLINIPFKLNETVFEYTGYEYDKDIMYNIAKLYVPTGRSSVYGVTTGWKKFMNIVEIDTKFKLTYIVDGTEYKSYEIQATEVVTPEPDPFKEGYIFSGWSTIPSIMPAHDVTVYGTFTVDPEYAGVETIESNGATPKSYYTIDGSRHESQQKGLNIIRMSDGTIKKVMMK